MNTIAVLAGIIATPFLPLLLPHGTIGLSHPPQASPEEYRQFKFLQDSLEQYKAGTESRFCLDDELCVNFYKGPASVAWFTVRGWPMTSESLALTAVMIYVLVMICRLLRRFDSDTQKIEPGGEEEKRIDSKRRDYTASARDSEVIEAAKADKPTFPASNDVPSGDNPEQGAWTTLKWPRRQLVDNLMESSGYHDAVAWERYDRHSMKLAEIREEVVEDVRQLDEMNMDPIMFANPSKPLNRSEREGQQEALDVAIKESAERGWDMV